MSGSSHGWPVAGFTARIVVRRYGRGGGRGLVGSAVSPVCCDRGGPGVRGCSITHVLLPLTVLLRRAYAVEVIGAALTARAQGSGFRPISTRLGVPAATVRGWLRIMSRRLATARVVFLGVAHRAGVDVAIPDGLGCPWRDVLAALGAATSSITARFGPRGVVGEVTGWQVATACSAGRLLAPGWPPTGGSGPSNTSCP